MLYRILVPVDFSPSSDAAITYAGIFAERFSSRVDVLHTGPSQKGEKMRGYLQELEDRGVDARACIEFGEPSRAIVGRAANYDLVIIGTDGRTGIRSFLRTTADRVSQEAGCPVLVIRAAR